MTKTHQDCHKCGHKGCLTIFEDGGEFCHSCGYKTGGTMEENVVEQRGTIKSLSDRCISFDTAKRYKVTVEVTNDGKTVHHYPYYSLDKNGNTGKRSAIKSRVVETKDFFTEGEINKTGLFGQNLFPPNSAKSITITEGECDAMSVFEMLGSRYPSVSVKSSSQALKDCKAAFDYLNSFEKIYLAFDMDEPGQKAAQKVSDLFELGKVRILKMRLKDANEYLKSGKDEDFKSDWYAAAPLVPDSIIMGNTLWDTVSKADNFDIIPYPWNELNKLTYGARLSEMVTITAGSGMGKTQVLRELQHYHLMTTPYNIGCLMLEEPIKSAALGIMSIEANKQLHLPRKQLVDNLQDTFGDAFDSLEGVEVDEKELKKYYDNTLGTGRICFYDHFGSNSIDTIIARIRHMVKVLGCRIIYLDHISILVSDQSNGDERKALDEIATKLKTLTIELDILLIMVSHSKRQATKPLEEGGATSLSDIRGTAGIGQLSNIVIGLERNGQDEDPIMRNTTLIRVVKNRFTGLTGPCSKLYYDKVTGRLHEKNDEELQLMAAYEYTEEL